MADERRFLVVTTSGDVTRIGPGYEELKDAIGNWFDFVAVRPELGMFVDDEGMLRGLTLNVPASIISGRPLYGSVVLTRGLPDDDGDSVPASEEVEATMVSLARAWASVRKAAAAQGQSVDSVANPDAIPPMSFASFASLDDMLHALSHCDECGCEHGAEGGEGRCECECHGAVRA